MASSSRGRADYPRRLFPPGKSPVQKRSLNNYCHLTDFGMMLEAVVDEVYNELMHGSQVGVILKLAKKPYVWAAKTVHNFVANQLYVDRIYEIWSLIGGRPIRFSLHEFKDITGLNCEPIVDDGWDIDHNKLWAEIGVNPGVGPNWHELVHVFEICKTWTFEKKKKVALLFVWRSTRERYNLDRVLEKEISTTRDKKVRVRHLLEVPREEIYPIWPDEPSTPDVDPKLHNMITDILDGRLDETAWDVGGNDSKKKKTPNKDKKEKKERKRIEKKEDEKEKKDTNDREEKEHKKERKEKKSKKEKEKEEEKDSEDDFIEDPTTKKRKVKSPPRSSREKKKEKMTNKKEKDVGSRKDVSDTEMLMSVGAFKKKVKVTKPREEENSGLLRAIQLLASKIDAIDDKVNSFVSKENVHVQGGPKGPVVEGKPGDAESNADGASKKKDRSWTVEMQDTSDPQFPIAKAVRTRKSQEQTLRKVKVEGRESNVKKKTETVKKKEVIYEQKEVPLRADQIKIPHLVDEPENDMLQALEKLMALPTVIHQHSPRIRRGRIIAATQYSPFAGSSVVRRVMGAGADVDPSYNPFEEVEQRKLDCLIQFIKQDLENPFDESIAAVEFYLTLMTPKEMWPSDEYGWLSGKHMSSGFDMLRSRSFRVPSPYRKGRVAFLNPFFSYIWCRDYSTKYLHDEENWIFPEAYINVAKGILNDSPFPPRKWGEDVDFLYIAHNMDNRHWVALEVDFAKRKIRVFDSVRWLYNDAYIEESVKPYTKMIPLLMKQIAPPEKRGKMRTQIYTTYRVKTAPPNTQTGDCGVYTLKYCECLALQHGWEPLRDSNMAGIRLKLAAEILEEADAEYHFERSDPNPRGASDDRYPFQTGSANL